MKLLKKLTSTILLIIIMFYYNFCFHFGLSKIILVYTYIITYKSDKDDKNNKLLIMIMYETENLNKFILNKCVYFYLQNIIYICIYIIKFSMNDF